MRLDRMRRVNRRVRSPRPFELDKNEEAKPYDQNPFHYFPYHLHVCLCFLLRLVNEKLFYCWVTGDSINSLMRSRVNSFLSFAKMRLRIGSEKRPYFRIVCLAASRTPGEGSPSMMTCA